MVTAQAAVLLKRGENLREACTRQDRAGCADQAEATGNTDNDEYPADILNR
jgi:hypothetical protein